MKKKPAARSNALIVDDVNSMRIILRGLLKKYGFYNVNEANDGQSALQELKKNNYDVIICDWEMPQVSGIEFLKQVRDNSEWDNIIFIMCTGNNDLESVNRAIKNGINNYMIKPISQHTMDEKLSQYFSY